MERNNRKKGSNYEAVAARFLEDKGVKILEKNYRFSNRGEIDIIGLDDGVIIFVEVKYRTSTSKGYAYEAVGKQKMRQICHISDFYRMSKKMSCDTPVRYDIVAIQGNELNWYKNAFPYIGM